MAKLILYNFETYETEENKYTPVPPKWKNIEHENPQFGDIVMADGSERSEAVYVVGLNQELKFIGHDIDWAVVPLCITSQFENPVEHYEDIYEDAILYIELNQKHCQSLGKNDAKDNVHYWYDFFSDKIQSD